MRFPYKKVTAGILAGSLVLAGIPLCVSAGSVSGSLPAAGAARALNEGVSVTAIRAEKIRSTGQVDASYVAAVTTAAAEATEKSAEEDEVIRIASEETEEKVKKTANESSSAPTEVPSAGAGNYSIETDGDQSSSATAAVLSETYGPEGEEEIPSEESDKEENADETPALSAGAGSAIEEKSESGSESEEEDAGGIVPV